MNVLILGGGGREHALAAALAKSPSLSRLFVAPGNPGCAALAENIALAIDDHAAIVDFCRAREVDLVVVGPEAPLVAGVVDDLAAAGILCFGPSKSAARLEGSKGFAKDFCREFGIPTGDYRRFADAASALAYVRAKGAPIVVKADGLAAGKGVVVAMTLEEAERAIQSMFAGAFGGAGAEVVVEDYLDGEELSFFALCDGTRAVPFAGAQDHKRVGDGDAGPNTGGMGAYSPPPLLTPALSEQLMREIVAPTVAGMAKRGAPFRGVLFVGLMVGADGPKLIEFNVRFGDPEAEAILARLDDDLLEFLLGCARGAAPDRALRFSDEAALTVIMAARGYPGAPEKGTLIRGLEAAAGAPGVSILHAGTRRDGDKLVADGGRVLAVTALGRGVAEAQARAYAAVDRIDWPGGFCRRDIGWRAVATKKGG
jgi:phosphoribosylamine--glycine ligase